MSDGQYVVFEGPGFCGKSTVMDGVKTELEKYGLRVVTTREPGGPLGAEAVRELIFRKKKDEELTPRQEVHLLYIARIINMTGDVLPVNERGKLVLKDRDYMATFMYQELSGMSRDELIEMHNYWYVAWGFPKPDLRLMFTISEETLFKRMELRGNEGDPFDKDALAMVRVYNAEALEIARGRGLFAPETRIIDANLPFEVVKDSCLELIKGELGLDENREGKRNGVEF